MNEKQQKDLQINKEIKEYQLDIIMKLKLNKKLHFLKIQDAKNRELSTQVRKILSR